MDSGIYQIKCLVNNKIYIGSSKNIYNRWKVHKRQLNKNNHINLFLQSSWNKYGEKNFQFYILEFCKENFLIEKEQYWMDYTQCYNRNKGFNACIKADRPLGYKHTKESKKIMSEIKKQQIKEGKIKNNLVLRKKGYKHTDETREKIKKSKLGKLNPNYGKKEEEGKKLKRMVNFLKTPKWNKGLTKDTDLRIIKLSTRKGITPSNAILHTLINKITGEKWEANSLKKLSEICPISLATLNRLKRNQSGIKITNIYKILW